MLNDSQAEGGPATMPALEKHRPGQAERSAAMRARLIAATRTSLMDSGYGRTTTVEVCARAGVTRGALLHHFSGLPDLFAATLEEVIEFYEKRFSLGLTAQERADLVAFLRAL